MDRSEHVRELRDRYEDALDQAEQLRAEYHREVLKLHRSGMSLREIAQELGISHQRVHQIVGVAEPAPKKWKRTAGGVAVALLLLVSGFALARFLRPDPGPVMGATSIVPSPARPCTVTAAEGKASSFSAKEVSRWLSMVPSSCHGSATILDPRTGKILGRIRYASQGQTRGVARSRSLSITYVGA